MARYTLSLALVALLTCCGRGADPAADGAVDADHEGEGADADLDEARDGEAEADLDLPLEADLTGAFTLTASLINPLDRQPEELVLTAELTQAGELPSGATITGALSSGAGWREPFDQPPAPISTGGAFELSTAQVDVPASLLEVLLADTTGSITLTGQVTGADAFEGELILALQRPELEGAGQLDFDVRLRGPFEAVRR